MHQRSHRRGRRAAHRGSRRIGGVAGRPVPVARRSRDDRRRRGRRDRTRRALSHTAVGDGAVGSNDSAGRAPRPRFSPSARIGVGIAAGVALGLFAGERTTVLQIAADAYIKLLQMTVLPYVTVSIVGGLGSLDAAQARALGVRVGLILALLWALALAAVLLFPLMFPPNLSASFFSTALLEEREPF